MVPGKRKKIDILTLENRITIDAIFKLEKMGIQGQMMGVCQRTDGGSEVIYITEQTNLGILQGGVLNVSSWWQLTVGWDNWEMQ